MLATAILVEKLNSQCSQSHVTPTQLTACCKTLLENYKFDCVFLAYSATPEETLSALAFDGKEEVMETCLYRLGVEERVALSKVPLKTYTDMTGKPVFTKSGSLRIQKPNSGVFMVLNRPRKSYLLLGLAHQNSQSYDQKLLEELTDVWKNWQDKLEKAVLAVAASPKGGEPAPAAKETGPKKESGSKPDGALAGAELQILKETSQKGENRKDGRRPVVLVDEVTRLYNQAYFSESLAVEVERAKRYSRTLSLMFLSVTPVDGAASRPNDDLVATQVAEILSKSLRKVDVICRVEKNKYGIVLPDTAQNTYGIIAKRVFKFFKQIMGDNPPVYLNISASTFPKHAENHLTLLDNAEKLLAQAQEVGPNKAVLPE